MGSTASSSSVTGRGTAGVTLFGRAFTDQYLLSLADAFQRAERLPLAGGACSSLPPRASN
jgi:allophanate hydrolase